MVPPKKPKQVAAKKPKLKPKKGPGKPKKPGKPTKTKNVPSPTTDPTEKKEKEVTQVEKKGKKDAQVEEKANDAVVQPLDRTIAIPTQDSWSKNKSEKIRTPDLLVIMVLWSLEVPFLLTESWRTSFTRDAPLEEGRLTKDLFAQQSSSVAMMIVTSFIMMTVASHFAGKDKYIMFLIGISIYMVTPFFGVKMLTPQPTLYAILMIISQIGWHAVNPIRYWLIFHQVFPLSVKKSMYIVSTNEILSALAEYVGAVWVEPRLFNNDIIYLVAWVTLMILLTAWLSALIYVRGKNFMNTTPDDVNAIENAYKSTEVAKSFEARRRLVHYELFSLLIFPSVMFAISKETISLAVNQIAYDPYNISLYRFDIIFSIICMPIITAFLVFQNNVRHEMRDMLNVGVAKLLNIVVFSLYLLSIFEDRTTFKSDTAFPETLAPQTTMVMPSTNRGLLSNAQVFVNNPTQEKLYHSFGLSNPFEKNPEALFVFEKQINKSVSEIVKFYYTNKTLFATQEIRIVPRTITYYVISFSKRRIRKINGLSKWFEALPDALIVLVGSDLDQCPGEDQSSDQNGKRVLLREGCRSIRITLSHLSADRLVVLDDDKLNAPDSGEFSEPYYPKKEAIQIVLTIFLDGQIYRQTPYPVEQDSKYMLFILHESMVPSSLDIWLQTIYRSTWERLHAPSIEEPTTCWDANEMVTTPLITITQPPEPSSRPESPVLYPMGLGGLALGIASVSYIHFIWIQCPYEYRLQILGGYFTANYIGGWLVRYFIVGINAYLMISLIVIQTLFWIWHAVVAYFFWRNLPEMAESETERGTDRQF